MTPTELLEQENSTMEVQVPTPKDEVVQAIIREATSKGVECDESLAGDVCNMIERALSDIRNPAHDHFYWLEHRESDFDRLHPVLETIMVAYETAPPDGSAHALINAHFLDAGAGERSLVHTGRPKLGCGLKIKVSRP